MSIYYNILNSFEDKTEKNDIPWLNGRCEIQDKIPGPGQNKFFKLKYHSPI